MDEDRIKHINGLIVQKEDEIQDIDKSFFGDVLGVSQALGQLKEALEKVDKCLKQRKFEKASSLGYGDVSSEFIFLQRCLGSLTGTIMKKEELIQNICLDLSKNYKEISNEEVAPLVEQKIESLKPIENPVQIEILIGKNTLEKLHSLHKINHTPIEHLVELILSSVMQNDKETLYELEKNREPILHIKDQKKEVYTSDEVDSHMKALKEQHKERHKNLY